MGSSFGEQQMQQQLQPLALSAQSEKLLDLEHQYAVGGFEPAPGFFVRGKGSKLWDVDGKEYIDFIAMFSAVNQGHCHPKIVGAVVAEMQNITLLNVATHVAAWPPFAQMMCQRFGYDKICAMVSGSEATDTACKTARKWGIKKKGIPADEALVLGVENSYHGLTSGVWNLQNPSAKRADYGLDNRLQLNYNPMTGAPLSYGDIRPMRECIEQHHSRIAAVIMEPLHGRLPSMKQEISYARGVYDLCKQYDILFIADEIRQGAGKTGRFLSHEHLGPDCKPDMVTMGKSITGGVYPASYVLGTEAVMSLIGTYETAGTFSCSPLGIAAARAAIQVIDDEGLCARAAHIGAYLTATVEGWHHPLVKYVTARGADAQIALQPGMGVTGPRLSALCSHMGLVTNHRANMLRLSIAMVISDEELVRGLAILKNALDQVTQYDDIPGEFWRRGGSKLVQQHAGSLLKSGI